jgi:ribosomal protein S12 methylthiotransferase accessory factor
VKLRDQVPKAHGGLVQREVPTEVTYDRMLPHLRRVGITRIADITGLDRIGIPVYNTICPRSFDVLSVYNGKGATPLDAKTSAIMEAVERFGATLPQRPAAIASYPELAQSGRAVLDPRDFNLELWRGYRLEMPISWIEGFDIMNERSVLVPLWLAGYYMYYHETPCYPISTTNGIASGNSLEEAICHALSELIERDDWTIADLISNRLARVIASGKLGTAGSAAAGHWLQESHPNIDLDSLPPRAQLFAQKFVDAGLTIECKNLTSATGIPTILATVAENVASTFSQSHQGLGAHPNAEVAVTRAISEVAQSRVVDINALREDIAPTTDDVPKHFYHVKRSSALNREAWAFKHSERTVSLSEIPTHPSDDVMIDLRLMLDRLRGRGLEQAIVVDLSPPGVPASVVRVIVPGIESWIVDRSKLGRRATAAWNGTLGSVREACELALAPTA